MSARSQHQLMLTTCLCAHVETCNSSDFLKCLDAYPHRAVSDKVHPAFQAVTEATMKKVCAVILSVVLLACAMPLSVLAVEPPSVFALPDGVAGSAYRASIPEILRDTYRLKLQSNARASVFRW